MTDYTLKVGRLDRIWNLIVEVKTWGGCKTSSVSKLTEWSSPPRAMATFVERISRVVCSRFGSVDIIGAVIRCHDRAGVIALAG